MTNINLRDGWPEEAVTELENIYSKGHVAIAQTIIDSLKETLPLNSEVTATANTTIVATVVDDALKTIPQTDLTLTFTPEVTYDIQEQANRYIFAHMFKEIVRRVEMNETSENEV